MEEEKQEPKDRSVQLAMKLVQWHDQLSGLSRCCYVGSCGSSPGRNLNPKDVGGTLVWWGKVLIVGELISQKQQESMSRRQGKVTSAVSIFSLIS